MFPWAYRRVDAFLVAPALQLNLIFWSVNVCTASGQGWERLGSSSFSLFAISVMPHLALDFTLVPDERVDSGENPGLLHYAKVLEERVQGTTRKGYWESFSGALRRRSVGVDCDTESISIVAAKQALQPFGRGDVEC